MVFTRRRAHPTSSRHPNGWRFRAREVTPLGVSNFNVNWNKRRCQRRGFTLIEMLCVMGIIAVLMGLLFGPLGRVMKQATAMQWAQDSQVQLGHIVSRLQSRFQGKTNFPSITLEFIESQAWLEPLQLQFLKDRRVTFTPFAGSDPDDKVLIQVKIEAGFLTEADFLTVTKEDITKIPQ
jgi:prepilin-type N-terminal cleavage/methylation domain-containing protein